MGQRGQFVEVLILLSLGADDDLIIPEVDASSTVVFEKCFKSRVAGLGQVEQRLLARGSIVTSERGHLLQESRVAWFVYGRIGRRNGWAERPTGHDGHEEGQAISHSVSGGTA